MCPTQNNSSSLSEFPRSSARKAAGEIDVNRHSSRQDLSEPLCNCPRRGLEQAALSKFTYLKMGPVYSRASPRAVDDALGKS